MPNPTVQDDLGFGISTRTSPEDAAATLNAINNDHGAFDNYGRTPSKGPTREQALEGLTPEQVAMFSGLTPDEIIGARRGPVTEGKIGDPNQKVMDVPAYGAKGTANQPTIPMPTEDVGDYGPKTGPAPTAQPVSSPPLLTDNAIAAARPALSRGAYARGGSPGQQAGGPTGDGDSIDAPVKIEDDFHQALVQSGVHPEIAAMLADQKKRQDQLADAAKEQRGERFAADELYAMRSGFGIRGADELHKSALQTADNKLQLAKDQQRAGDEALTHAEAQRGFTRALDMDDPGSEISRQVQQITGQKGVPASLYPQIADKLKAAATVKEKAAELKQKQSEEAGRTARQQMQDETELEKARIMSSARGQGKDPAMTASQEQQLADIRAARAMVQKLDAEQESKGVSGWSSGLSALLGKLGINTDAAQVDTQGKMAARVVGRGIEAGKFSDQDAQFYQQNAVGQAGDARELQRAKNRAALQRLDQKEKELLSVMGQSGRNTGSLQPQSSGAGQSAADAPVGTRRPGPGGKMYRKVGPGQWQAD